MSFLVDIVVFCFVIISSQLSQISFGAEDFVLEQTEAVASRVWRDLLRQEDGEGDRAV